VVRLAVPEGVLTAPVSEPIGPLVTTKLTVTVLFRLPLAPLTVSV
jgi:hypothetical protein